MILLDIHVPSLPQYCTSPRGGLETSGKPSPFPLSRNLPFNLPMSIQHPSEGFSSAAEWTDSLCKPEHRLGSICLLLQWDKDDSLGSRLNQVQCSA